MVAKAKAKRQGKVVDARYSEYGKLGGRPPNRAKLQLRRLQDRFLQGVTDQDIDLFRKALMAGVRKGNHHFMTLFAKLTIGEVQHLQVGDPDGGPIQLPNVQILNLITTDPDARRMATALFGRVAVGQGDAGGAGLVREPEEMAAGPTSPDA